jgi:hypothetical protein
MAVSLAPFTFKAFVEQQHLILSQSTYTSMQPKGGVCCITIAL